MWPSAEYGNKAAVSGNVRESEMQRERNFPISPWRYEWNKMRALKGKQVSKSSSTGNLCRHAWPATSPQPWHLTVLYPVTLVLLASLIITIMMMMIITATSLKATLNPVPATFTELTGQVTRTCEWMNEQMNEWMKEWLHTWINQQTSECAFKKKYSQKSKNWLKLSMGILGISKWNHFFSHLKFKGEEVTALRATSVGPECSWLWG